MVQTAQGWELEVERGPDWLFVRPHSIGQDNSNGTALAGMIWNLLEQNFTHRLVLELDDVPILHSQLIGQLLLLQKRLCNAGGLLRMSGLSGKNTEVLKATRVDERLPCYSTRTEAVMCGRAVPR